LAPLFGVLRRLKHSGYSVAAGAASPDCRTCQNEAAMYHLEDSQLTLTRLQSSIEAETNLVWR